MPCRLQSPWPSTHYQAMWKRFRAALARFAVRRAAACQRHAPKRAAAWLRLACLWAPAFGEPYVALVHLSRAMEDRWAALATAQEATERFRENPDAWMLLGDASQMVFRQREALGAYEQALALEERVDAAMAAGEVYRRAGDDADAAARCSRAYAAGGGPEALWQNAQSLFPAGEHAAAEQARTLWATLVPDGVEEVKEGRGRRRGGGS